MSFLGFRLGALVGASCFRRTSTFSGKGALFVLHLTRVAMRWRISTKSSAGQRVPSRKVRFIL